MTTYHFTIETTDYLNFANKSINKLSLDLSQQGVNTELINNALSALDKNRGKLEKIKQFVNPSSQDSVPLFIYPYSINDSKDLDEDKDILSVSVFEGTYYLKTYGLMGFISATFKGDDDNDYHFNIYIHSRFDYKNDKILFKQNTEDGSADDNPPNFNHDYFLHYMLQRVLNINLFECDPDTKDNQSELELLLYFFPGLLRRAMKQGLYKQYVHREYNDAKVRGPIDVSRLIRYNIPFCGKIAYSATEYDYDNPITELVRHTIEYIRHHEWASGLLSQRDETRQDVQLIVNNTERYSANERCRIIQQNLRLLNHPFYTEWRPLQHLCLSILRHDDIRYDSAEDEDRIHGILFDGPWLWERYLEWLYKNHDVDGVNTKDFIHPDNITKKNAICLFSKESNSEETNSIEGNGRIRKYPDFYKKVNDNVCGNCGKKCQKKQCAEEIWDAKFKPYDKNAINREDVHQLITYLYIQSGLNEIGNSKHDDYPNYYGYICKTAGVVFPIGVDDNENESYCSEVGTLMGFGAKLYKWGLKIPSFTKTGEKINNYSVFTVEMRNSEMDFIDKKRR